MKCVNDILNEFVALRKADDYVIDKSGVKMLELIGATFLADKTAIIGTVNEEYVQRELDWYKSMSLNVNDIPPPVPAIWKAVADKDGLINSNYGYLIWSAENTFQYDHVLTELKTNPFSRRANMIYTRPTIWDEFNFNGRSDFICTDAVQYFIRKNKLIAHVRMRSNDAIFGYKNDFAWQKHVLDKLANDLSVPPGDIIWTAGSLHIYERHFHLLDVYANQ
jgi:thymidylate synthase